MNIDILLSQKFYCLWILLKQKQKPNQTKNKQQQKKQKKNKKNPTHFIVTSVGDTNWIITFFSRDWILFLIPMLGNSFYHGKILIKIV